jgi:deoxycytidine triphosphate deaminase
MKLGGGKLGDLFQGGHWRAYRGETLLSWAEVEPLIGPNSIDVTLSSKFLVPRLPTELLADHLDTVQPVYSDSSNTPDLKADAGEGTHIPVVDPRDAASLEWDEIEVPPGGDLTIHPGVFMLGAVRERFICEASVRCGHFSDPVKYFAPMYEGRSSCGRLGIASHITAGFGDYGFGGAFTLEIFSHFPYPVRLHPGMRIGQVAFEEVFEPKVYQGAYAGTNHHDGPVPPKLGPYRF